VQKHIGVTHTCNSFISKNVSQQRARYGDTHAIIHQNYVDTINTYFSTDAKNDGREP